MQRGGPSPKDSARAGAISMEARPLIEAATELFKLIEGEPEGISHDRVTINDVTFRVTFYDRFNMFEYWREEPKQAVVQYGSMDALMDAFYCYMSEIIPKETKE